MAQEKQVIGSLKIEPIREAFPHEAHHFTRWMEEHIGALAERLKLDLTVVQREKAVGAFNVDLLCEGKDGRAVIVENQLEATDHDHLGKMLTYLVNLDATSAIWVTSDPRPEHQKVVDWLNESTPATISFYLVKAEAAHIGDSPAAPLFTVVAGPSAQGKQTGHEKKEWAERQVRLNEFWTQLLERSRGRTKLFASISAGRQYWIGTGAGRAGVAFNYCALTDSGTVELYINRGTAEKNKAVFDALHADREGIEHAFGGPLEWQRLDDKQACRIMVRVSGGGLANEDSWPALQDQMIDAMIRFHDAIRPRLDKVKV